MSSALAPWSNFFVAELGAAAALTGLVIVAVSINLARILSYPMLPGRAAETLALLMGVLVVASFGLVPGQPLWAFGVEALVVAGVVLLMSLASTFKHWRTVAAEHRGERIYTRLGLMLLVTAVAATGGMVLMTGSAAGLYWVMAGVLLSLMVGVLNAWVLLVEIVR
jgi:type III secretory pathway component EscV